jgi:hypothetical protein
MSLLDLVDVAACGSKIVLCISEQIYTLRGEGWLQADVYAACSVCVGGLSLGDVDSCRDDPQYNVMKCLVFGTISSSLLSELQVIIPKTDRNGVYIDMVKPTL